MKILMIVIIWVLFILYNFNNKSKLMGIISLVISLINNNNYL